MSRKILPEACYNVKEDMKLNDCVKAFKRRKTVYGTVTEIVEKDMSLTVRLGVDLYAKLYFDEVSIYPLKYSNNSKYKLPFQVYTLLNKQIAVKILSIKNGNIILSRKNNMIESFKLLKNSRSLQFFVTQVTQSEVFGDVGDGIIAKIPIYELCKSRIRSAFEVICKNSLITVKVVSCDNKNSRFDVSYKAVFEKYDPDSYKKGDIISCTVNELVDDCSGYFANISPQVVGIIDKLYWMPKLTYGDKVDCVVTSASKKGLHLKFLCYTY